MQTQHTTCNPRASDLLPAVVEAVRNAGATLRAEARRPGGPRGHGSSAPVDAEVERALRSSLLALHSCAWLGEETGRVGDGSGDRWIVDGHDGTRDFLLGLRGSAVSVALVRAGRPILGVVFAPLAPDDAGDLVAWAEGTALTRNGRPVRPGQAGVPLTIAMNADAGDYALANHRALAGLRIRALPSPAYRLALAAVGHVDAAVSLVSGLAPWDIAGGHALLVGAGKAFTDLAGRPVDRAGDGIDGCIGGSAALVGRLAGLVPGRGRVARAPARPRRPVADVGGLSRAQGCLLGQFAGDALGAQVEFRSAADIARAYPAGVTTLADGGTWGTLAGQPTDDSEMALALARSLVAEGGFDAAAVGRAYVAWGGSGPFDIGSTTSAGLRAIAAGRAPASDSQANGALMRVSPIGILAAGDPEAAAHLAAVDAGLTHPHPVCRAASAAYAAAIAVGIASGDPRAMLAAARRYAGDDAAGDTIRARLDAALAGPPAEFQRQMGWVLTAFQNAFHHLAAGRGLADALTATVGQGGDTDTNAAICGALLGACQGRDAVPLQWRNAVLTCRPVQAPGVRHPRPPRYWPDDALELAEALLTARETD